jgi:hypothetical protein
LRTINRCRESFLEVAGRNDFDTDLRFWTDIAAAFLLDWRRSRSLNVLLIGPLKRLLWWRRRFWAGLVVGAVFAVTVAGSSAPALSSGEFNFSAATGGRSNGRFRSTRRGTWDHLRGSRRSLEMTTNYRMPTTCSIGSSRIVSRATSNFLIGLHSGSCRIFRVRGPSSVAGVAHRSDAWRVLTFLGLAASTLVLLVFFPHLERDGPVGNRYFPNLYPVLFVTPPFAHFHGPGGRRLGGRRLFTAQMVVNPFVSQSFDSIHRTRRRAPSPVELTMANDLPVALDVSRAHVRTRNPVVLLHFSIPTPTSPTGLRSSRRWCGSFAAAVRYRAEDRGPLDHLKMTAESPIQTVFTVSAAERFRGSSRPGQVASLLTPASGVRGLKSYAHGCPSVQAKALRNT